MGMFSAAVDAVNGTIGVVKSFVGASNTDGGEAPVELTDGEKYYKLSLDEQKAFHPVWYRNIAMYAGQQWLDFSSQTNWFQETAAPSWRVRLTTNLILPKVRALIAKELQTNPRFYGMPSNGNQASKDAAKITSRILEAKYFEDDFLNLMILLRLWTRMTGSAYLVPLWNPKAGKTWTDVEMDEAGQPVLDEAGQPKMKMYGVGDIEFHVFNSFEVMVQPGAPENFSKHRKLMFVRLMDIDDIESNWGVKVEPEKITIDIMYQARVMSLVDASGRYKAGGAESALLKNMALVKDYFEIPSVKYPNGRHFTYANGKVLLPTEDLDYYYGGKRVLPGGKSDDITMPGRSQGASTIEHATPLNVQYNKMTSQTVENGNLMGRPKVLAPKGSLDEESFTDQPGEVVEYNIQAGGQVPTAFKPAEMPQYFHNQKEELKQGVEDIFGTHDVSLGRLPRRANSGVAIDALQSADDGPVALSIKSCASALSRCMSIAVDQMQRKYTEQRIVHMVGNDHEVEVIAFKGADLKGCDFVRVTFGPHLTRMQRIDLAMQMAKEGLITKEQALEMMELGDMNVIFDGNSFQKNYARIENAGLAKGIAYPVGILEPHPVHKKEHLAYIQGEGANLPPEIAMVFKQHIDEHSMLEAQAFGPQGPLPGGGEPPAGPGAAPLPPPGGPGGA